MTKTFIIATGNVDAEGDMIMPGALKMPENKNIPVLRDFKAYDRVGKVIGIKEANGNFIADAELNEDFSKFYPGIGFYIVKSHTEGDVRAIDEMKLMSVGLSTYPNPDPSIKTIGEQTRNDRS